MSGANGNGPADPIEVIDLVSSPPQSPVGGKRKASDSAIVLSDSENAPNPGKKARPSGLVELKGRKLVFNQTPFERPQLNRRQLLKLQMDLLDAIEDGAPLKELPEKYYGLIVMAGHELTSATEAAFIKAIKTELTKGQDDILPVDLLADPVKKLFTLTQYGFLASDFGAAASRFPASLQSRVWEANDVKKYFPEENVEHILERRAERERAREECVRIVAAMDDAEKSEIIKGDKAKDDVPSATAASKVKQAVAAKSSRDATPTGAASPSRPTSASPAKRVKSAEEEAEAKRKQEEKEARKAEREEKKKEQEEKKAEREAQREAKRVELEEKKAEKEREQKKAAAVKAKQAQMFGNFFAKQAKLAAKAGSSGSRQSADASSSKSHLSDFEKTFKPPPARANVKWMPINYFQEPSYKQQMSSSEPASEESVASWTPRDFINDHLSRHNIRRRTPRSDIPRGLKTAPLFGSVADMYAEYQSAVDPRQIRKRLLNTDKFPRKVLAFDQQARPPYTGTFTKSSVVVGPRTPFQQDPLFDYSYDSGDDWMEDEGGEDVDEGDPDAEADEDVSEDDEEGEFDDWLDNTEDQLFKPDADGDIPMLGATPPPVASVHAAVKRKIPLKHIQKLNQDCQGPFWESEIGKHPAEEWNPYRIQLLNDAPSSLDPFKYQSSEPVPLLKATFADTAVGMQIGIKCLLTTEETTPKAAQPAAATAQMPLGDASSTANAPGSRSRSAPKIAFPTSQLPELLRKIDGSPKIQSDLVSELRNHFDTVTKAAIEAKIREVASREGKGKDSRWRVKNEAWTSAGLTPPARGIMAAFEKA